MKGQQLIRICALTILGVALPASRGQEKTLIVPEEAKEVYGGIFANVFFEVWGGATEQIYDSSLFEGAQPGVLLITGLAFRLDDSSDRPMNAVVSGLQLRLNVFKGTFDEAGLNGTGIQEPQTTVFSGENVRLTGEVEDFSDFDVHFQFQTPFPYDRRLGPLVLEILESGTYSGTGANSMDAHYAFNQGTFYYLEQFGYRRAIAAVMATEFTYQTMGASITEVKRTDNNVELAFTIFGQPELVTLEGASEVNGPYKILDDVHLITTESGMMRAVIPLPSDDKLFFRLRME